MDTVAPAIPASPEALVAAVACPFKRVVFVTGLVEVLGNRLPGGLSRQRRRDILIVLKSHTQSDIAAETGLSRQRVSRLVREAKTEDARHD